MRIRGAGRGVALLSWKYKMQNTPYDWKNNLNKNRLIFFYAKHNFLRVFEIEYVEIHPNTHFNDLEI